MIHHRLWLLFFTCLGIQYTYSEEKNKDDITHVAFHPFIEEYDTAKKIMQESNA